MAALTNGDECWNEDPFEKVRLLLCRGLRGEVLVNIGIRGGGFNIGVGGEVS